ncbi:MAG TPA: TetR/AcrR family transcriptional regulator [Bacteroidales bacterium]|nr:TetR/AcrR family transcriptional regulator [Bacteroidales bacterium]
MDVRKRIAEEAAGLFRTYGIKSVTMDSIAANLGMSKRTIYETFADKDDLIMSVLRMMAGKQKLMIEKVLGDSDNSIEAIFRLLEMSRDHFHAMSPAFFADLKKYHHDVLVKAADISAMAEFRNNQAVIENGVKEGYFRDDIDPDIVNRGLYLLGQSIVDNELFPYEQFTRHDIIMNIFINYIKGISTQKGLKMIEVLESRF